MRAVVLSLHAGAVGLISVMDWAIVLCGRRTYSVRIVCCVVDAPTVCGFVCCVVDAPTVSEMCVCGRVTVSKD